jgi:hypothetical protein
MQNEKIEKYTGPVYSLRSKPPKKKPRPRRAEYMRYANGYSGPVFIWV